VLVERDKLLTSSAAERQRYRREILRRLDATSLPVQSIIDTLGVGQAYASKIRRGLVVPLLLYYATLERLVDTAVSGRKE
jgi:hypothetical protein